MDFLRTPAIGKMIHRYLDHRDTGIVYSARPVPSRRMWFMISVTAIQRD
jgi:hypothetical protein